MIKEAALNGVWVPSFLKAKKQPSVKTKGEATPLSLWASYFLIAANLVLLMSYIYGVNEFAGKGYDIKNLQTQVSGLNEANKQINLQVSAASSMVSIQSDFLSANFVPAGSPKFLQASQLSELPSNLQ